MTARDFIGMELAELNNEPIIQKEPVEQYPVPIIEDMCHVDHENVNSTEIARAYYNIKSQVTKDTDASIVQQLNEAFVAAVQNSITDDSENTSPSLDGDSMIEEG